MNVFNAIFDQTILNGSRILVNILIRLVVCNLLDYDDIVLINCSDKILAVLSEILTHSLKDIGILTVWRLNNEHCTFHISLNM